MAKRNPLNLNTLQLKTLTLFQHLAESAGQAQADGSVAIHVPHPHGDHFHLGDATVLRSDATGLSNPSVWLALERKGLIAGNFPTVVRLTATGRAYETGLGPQILHRSDH